MMYTCNACRYTFEGEDGLQQCPDCGKVALREATAQEVEEYKRYQEERRTDPLE